MKNIDKRLDTIFSIYIRLKYTDDNGIGYCYTCNDKHNYFEFDCGHFIRRGNTQFRWYKNNGKLQCIKCNRELDGNLEVYRDRLINDIGLYDIARMEFQSKQAYKWSKSDKTELFKQLKTECKELLKEKMFNVKLP